MLPQGGSLRPTQALLETRPAPGFLIPRATGALPRRPQQALGCAGKAHHTSHFRLPTLEVAAPGRASSQGLSSASSATQRAGSCTVPRCAMCPDLITGIMGLVFAGARVGNAWSFGQPDLAGPIAMRACCKLLSVLGCDASAAVDSALLKPRAHGHAPLPFPPPFPQVKSTAVRPRSHLTNPKSWPSSWRPTSFNFDIDNPHRSSLRIAWQCQPSSITSKARRKATAAQRPTRSIPSP